MAHRITMTPSDMRRCASTIRAEAETFNEVIRKTDKTINDLCSQWEGRASTEFREKFARYKPILTDCYNDMNIMCDNLIKVAQSTEDHDDNIGNQFAQM